MIRRCPLGRVEVWVLRGDFGLAIRVSSGARVGEPGGFLLGIWHLLRVGKSFHTGMGFGGANRFHREVERSRIH